MTKICHVVGAGDFDAALLSPGKEDLILAADAGFRHLTDAGIRPHLYIGDGDSLGFQPHGIETVVLPKVKDDTDTVAALREGLARGYRHFYLYGTLGGDRFSHSLANIQALAFLAKNGAEGTLVDTKCRIQLLLPGEYSMDLKGGFFSLFAFSQKAEISISGAKYPLDKATLSPDFPLGVSNEGSLQTKISVHRGWVLLVRESLRPKGTNP